MDFRVHTIKMKDMRYPTVGDYRFSHGKLKEVMVADMNNEAYEWLVAFHEQSEATLCLGKGITEKEINGFDIQYEKARAKGIKSKCGCKPTMKSEPGWDRHAPYYKEHKFAEMLERMMAKEMGICWEEYNKTVESL